MTGNSIVDKIKKLLALAEGNQNHHERENAMQFAAALLAKHNLTIAELESREFASTVTSVEVFINLERWVENVLGAACMLFYTDYYTGKRQNRIDHVSLPDNTRRRQPGILPERFENGPGGMGPESHYTG